MAGDVVLTRDEGDPSADVCGRAVEEVFTRSARVLAVRAGGRVVRTTAEHPFWVEGKGWTAAGALAVGDRILGHDNQATSVEGVDDTGNWGAVYNVRVAQHHTYFVGKDEWGFSLWTHNQYRTQAEFERAEGPFSSPKAAKRAWNCFLLVQRQLAREGEQLIVDPDNPVSYPPIKPGASGGPTAGQRFSDEVIAQAYAENPEGRCVYCLRCGPDLELNVDHAIPRNCGGNATIDNAQIVCDYCNSSKRDRSHPVNPPPGYEGPWPRIQ